MESWGEKKYRNLFEEAGHTQKEITERLEEIWHTFFTVQKRSGSIIRWGMIWATWRIPETMMPEQRACPMA